MINCGLILLSVQLASTLSLLSASRTSPGTGKLNTQKNTVFRYLSRKENPGAWTRTAGAGVSKEENSRIPRIILLKRFFSGLYHRKKLLQNQRRSLLGFPGGFRIP